MLSFVPRMYSPKLSVCLALHFVHRWWVDFVQDKLNIKQILHTHAQKLCPKLLFSQL